FDNNGCVVGYECRTSTNVNQQCANVVTPAKDDAGNCKEFSNSCIPPGWHPVDRCDSFKAPFCGDSRCDIGENPQTCPQDCSGSVQTRTTQTCPDGSQIQCKQGADGQTFCDQCPVQNLPEGCHQERDDRGFVRVVCESKRVCAEVPQDVRLKCVEQKGIPIFKKDPSGCEQFSCQFSSEASNPFSGYQECPIKTKQQGQDEMNKCSSLGLRGVFVFEGGCNIVRCVEERREEQCPHVSSQEKEKINSECLAKGFQGIRNRFEGCREIIECASSDQGQYSCPRDMPPEAYKMCSEKGGELVVQRNQDGCIKFSRCIARGDASAAYVERPTRILEASELLSLAFKLESLAVELDKLSKQTNDIALYYKSTNSADEGRFQRVSGMFSAAREKVDEIKSKIRSKVDSMTEDDVLEIKRDIKYLNDVTIKDILYVMLSSSEDVTNLASSEESGDDCGSDGGCFDEAFRVCEPITFEPDREVTVSIVGLDGDNCILKARMKEGKGPPAGIIPGVNPPYEMTCKVKNYALGMKGPEDIMPFCEGSMVELMKKFGPNGENAPGVPGKCSGDSCKDYCGKGPTEAKECLEHLGPYLPPEAKQGLEMLASGKGGFGQQGGFNQQSFGQNFEQQSYKPQQSIRPEQCEFTDMSDEECVDYILKNLGQPPECRGLTEAQCRKFVVRKWENQRQAPAQSYGGPQQFQSQQQFNQPAGQQFGGQKQFNQAYCGDGICDDFERSSSACNEDCGRQQQFQGGGFNQPVQEFIRQDYGGYEGGPQPGYRDVQQRYSQPVEQQQIAQPVAQEGRG
ncbi:MAG: hypothetical protein HYW27_02180, partial [Candidatus Aenigmarchaeota archaeon]|nr:hypothetical protein [Candidatus Aenigmarchaeota archaeon]